ncbi:GNAT family N-acetyltransferase [Pseudaquidulcibacter saccharophilus]|uniref:GNAT family N-acetyltransferase n=1 Tax=Pseudaquidulcibacter saccharophilus TaxID=2831900 RepID=UPI001EFF2F50|nr:GNAT family N-acetyltransferase [Pseudaquidulcibacter saccharophilus]
MTDNITIREANANDIARIEYLVETTYRGEDSKKGWTTEFNLLAGTRLQKGEIAAALADKANQFFVAERDNIVVGVICVNKNGDWIEFGKFSVDPEMQGLGIGKMLIAKVEDFVRNIWGADKLKLSVISIRKELVDFYARYGFKDTGQRIDFIKIHPYVELKDGVSDFEVIIMEKSV